ncbi:MAG TPA: hypothetical protein VEW93_10665 [Acidimicrobiales bacterium]|nr:hypothetical protein [Acidimicrobiales bacterium]
MSLAELLVGLGAASLVAAVAVFAAVTWDRLDAAVQGMVLVGVTGLVLAVAVLARRRGLVATAEALGAVGVALGLADVQVLRVALAGVGDPVVVTAAGLAAVAAGAIGLGRSAGVRSLTAAGAAVAFLPGPLLAAGSGSLMAVAGVLVAQVGLGLVAAGLLGRWRLERAVVVMATAGCWALAGSIALGLGVEGLVSDRMVAPGGSAALLLALAVVTTIGAMRVPPGHPVGAALLALAPLPALAALGLGTAWWADDAETWAAALVVGSAAAAVAAGLLDRLDRGRPWSASALLPALVTLAAGTWAGIQVVATATAVAGSVELGGGTAGESVAARLGRALPDEVLLADGTTLWVLMTGAVALAAARALGHRWARAPLGLLAVASAVAVPPAVGLAVGTTVVALLVIAGVGAVLPVAARPVASASVSPSGEQPPSWWSTRPVARAPWSVGRGRGAPWRETDREPGSTPGPWPGRPLRPVEVLYGGGQTSPLAQAVVGALAGLAVALALPSEELGLVALVVVATGAVTGAVVAVVRDQPRADTHVGGALAVALGAVAVGSVLVGAGGSRPALAVAVAAALGAGVGPLVERRGEVRAAAVAGSADVVAAIGLVLAGVACSSLDAVSGVVAVAGLTFAASALRPTRRDAVIAALGCAVLFGWLRLAAAEVDVPEAYSLLLAAGLLVAGAVATRGQQVGSWTRLGPGLAVAVGPTTMAALVGGGLGRTAVAVGAGLALVVWGAVGRLQAPLGVGAAVLGALALRHLGPVASDLPRYLVFAVAGVVLVALGATFEQRRQDVRHARDTFSRLG